MKKITVIILCLTMVLASFSVAFADEAQIVVTKSADDVKMGDMFTITVSVSGLEPIKAGALAFDLDTDVFEVVSGQWLVDNPLIQDFNTERMHGVFNYATARDINGDIFSLTLRAKEDAADAGSMDIVIEPQLQNEENTDVSPETSLTATVNVSCSEHIYGDLIPEVPAKCEAEGKAAYYECSVCHKLFDENKNETTEEALVLTALGHLPADEWTSGNDEHWKVCVNDGCGMIIESTRASHTFTWKIDKPATEDETGLQHEECTVCGFTRNENTEVPVLEHTHTGVTFHPEVAATCHSTGTAGYWTCASDKCAGIYYADEACSITIESITIPVDAENHDGGTEIRGAVAATCVQDGYSGDTYCLGCGTKIADGKVLPATGVHVDADNKWESDTENHWHTCACGAIFDTEKHKGGEATCVSKAECSVCGTEYGAIDSDNHVNTEIRGYIAATEDKEGYTGDVWCRDCGLKIADGTVTPKLTHTHNMVKVEAKEPTAQEPGNTEYYTCTKCGKLYSDVDGNNEITLADTVIQKTADEQTPKTADNNDLWIPLTIMLSCMGAFAALAAKSKNNN